MSDPVPLKLKARPKLAEPIQPDAPWRGDDAVSSSPTPAETGVPTDAPAEASAADAADPARQALQKRSQARQAEQTEQALRNNSEGFD